MKKRPIRLGGCRTAVLLAALAAPTVMSTAPEAHAAPSRPAPKKTTARPAAPKPATGEPSEVAKQAFLKVVEEIKQKISSAPAERREKAARDGVTRLQQYARTHAGKPISDSARLTAAHLQLQLGQTEEAIVVFREVAARPIDKQAGWAAQLSLAQSLAQTGKSDEAEKILNAIVAKNEDKELTEAAQGALAALSIRPGRKPPAFVAKDTAGKTHSLAEYEGKVLLIDFWATWCGPCREEIPNVKKVYDRFKDQGFAVIGISLDRKQSDLDSYVKEQAMPWPQVFEGAQMIAQQYGVTAIPHVLLLDRQGVIRYVDPRGPELEKAVAELMAAEKK